MRRLQRRWLVGAFILVACTLHLSQNASELAKSTPPEPTPTGPTTPLSVSVGER